MLAHLSLKHIHQRVASFLRLIQRSGITSRKLCTAIFRHLGLFLRFLLSRCQILREKKWRNLSFSFLGLTKPKIDEESGSTINPDGQSQVSGAMNDYRVHAYFAARYWWAGHYSPQQRSILYLSFYHWTARWFKFFTNAECSLAKSWNAVSEWRSNHTLTPYICVWRFWSTNMYYTIPFCVVPDHWYTSSSPPSTRLSFWLNGICQKTWFRRNLQIDQQYDPGYKLFTNVIWSLHRSLSWGDFFHFNACGRPGNSGPGPIWHLSCSSREFLTIWKEEKNVRVQCLLSFFI